MSVVLIFNINIEICGRQVHQIGSKVKGSKAHAWTFKWKEITSLNKYQLTIIKFQNTQIDGISIIFKL